MDDGPIGAAMALAVVVGAVFAFSMCVRALVWAISALFVLVQ